MKKMFAVGLLLVFLISKPTEALEKSEATTKNTDGVAQTSFLSFDKAGDGYSIAVGDLGKDGVAEIVVGSGFGAPAEVRLFRQDGSLINSFQPYEKFDRGISVTIGDVDGDGIGDIITGPAYGGGPHIRVFDSYGHLRNEFFAYQPTFLGGVFVAARDVDNDGKDEIITGAGPSGGSHVKIFKPDGTLVSEFFANEPNDQSGVTVGTITIDGQPHIVTGRASSDPPTIKIFTPPGKERLSFNAYDDAFRGGVSALGADVNSDGKEEIVVAPNGLGESVKIFTTSGQALETLNINRGTQAIKIASAPLLKNELPSLVTIPARSLREGPIEHKKYILVDLSEQRLYAYEHGILVNSFLVSTGVRRWPTPPGEYEVQRKIPVMDYSWNYGPGHPENYFLPNVQWNLQFKPHYYLHDAYWHHDFGRPKSHGCVNMNYESSFWTYHWAELGTPVVVQQ